MAWWRDPWRQPRVLRRRHRRLPALVAAAGADRGAVLVQRRQVADDLAGLLDAVVLGRPAAVGVARREPAHRAVPDPRARRAHHRDHGAARGAVRARHRPLARPAARGLRTVMMLLSFVLPEIAARASRCCSWSTVVAARSTLGTTAQVVGLVTFQLSYPVVHRARPPAHDRHAVRGGGRGPRRLAARGGAPGAAADAVPGDLRQRRAGVRRRHRRLRASCATSPATRRTEPVVGEDLQHRARGADPGAERAGDAAAARDRAASSSTVGYPGGYRWFTRGENGTPTAASTASRARPRLAEPPCSTGLG